MARQNASLEQSAQHAERQARRAAQNPWFERLMRSGYLAKGLVYAIVGVLAAQAAFGAGGATTDTRGALGAIVTQPFGRFLIALVALGLVGYAFWRFAAAAYDPDGKGTDAQGLATRVGYAFSGVAYLGLALAAAQLALGNGGGGGDSTQDWTARVLAVPFGRWLVGIGGLIVIGIGIMQLYKACTATFREKLKLGEMSATEETWVTRLGRFGLAARGVVFGIIGVFLALAAFQYDPSEARGLGGALATLAQQPFGPWLLGLVALGLIAYGVYLAALARYRRMLGA
jgi:hypothetical protein